MKTKEKLLYSGFYKLWRVRRGGHTREVLETRDSAVLLIYVPEIDSVVFIEQSREPMRSNDNTSGIILELPAGIFDEKFSPQELMAKEAFEETGVKIKPENITLINNGAPLASSPGYSTEKKYLGYAEVSLEQIDLTKKEFGLAREGESIKRLIIPVQIAAEMEFKDLTTLALVQWFLHKEGRA